MDHRELDFLIEELESMIPNVSGILSAFEHHDWRPIFAKAKEIQAGFKAHVLYPTKREREMAWIRFNDLRTLAFGRANSERQRFRQESETIRDDLLKYVKHADYSKAVDTMFFFLPTTVEEMKRKGETLKEAGQMLSQNKHRMLKEHKDEVFERIQEIQLTHRDFWGRYTQMIEHKRADSIRKRQEISERIRGNITANTDKLEKALFALAKVEANLEANLERLSSARNGDFADRVSGWIEEDEERRRSIQESTERIRSWIEEDEKRLSDLEERNWR